MRRRLKRRVGITAGQRLAGQDEGLFLDGLQGIENCLKLFAVDMALARRLTCLVNGLRNHGKHGLAHELHDSVREDRVVMHHWAEVILARYIRGDTNVDDPGGREYRTELYL